jgi:hypothetical protein
MNVVVQDVHIYARLSIMYAQSICKETVTLRIHISASKRGVDIRSTQV